MTSSVGFLCPRYRAGVSDAPTDWSGGHFDGFYALDIGLGLATRVDDHAGYGADMPCFYAFDVGLELVTKKALPKQFIIPPFLCPRYRAGVSDSRPPVGSAGTSPRVSMPSISGWG